MAAEPRQGGSSPPPLPALARALRAAPALSRLTAPPLSGPRHGGAGLRGGAGGGLGAGGRPLAQRPLAQRRGAAAGPNAAGAAPARRADGGGEGGAAAALRGGGRARPGGPRAAGEGAGAGGERGEPRGPGVEARPAALRWVLPCEGGGGDTALSPQLSCGVFLCRAAAVWVRLSGRAGCLLGAWHAAQVSGLCGSRPCHASSYRISKIPYDEDFPNICYHKC